MHKVLNGNVLTKSVKCKLLHALHHNSIRDPGRQQPNALQESDEDKGCEEKTESPLDAETVVYDGHCYSCNGHYDGKDSATSLSDRHGEGTVDYCCGRIKH